MTSSSTRSTTTGWPSTSLEVHLLGLVDFDAALFLQERLVYEISGRDDTLGGLLLCEHPPLITMGREGSRAHVLAEPNELISRQLDVRWLNRGGGGLVHAPGQLAVYPIVPLDRMRIGLAEYRRRLEESVIDLCRELRVPVHREADEPGVWGRSGQFAHVGASVKAWVSYHGLFVNVCPELELMRLVRNPDGGNGRDNRVTSLAAERQGRVSMHAVRAGLIRYLASHLGYEQYHLYTGHPLLRPMKKKVHVSA